jgi:membrane protein
VTGRRGQVTERDSDVRPDASESTTRLSVDRERVLRTLTFWLRPAFVLRVLNRFQLIAGFDRAMALASSALTALIPLAVLAGAVLPHVQAEGVANWLITRYGLTGGGAEAVKEALAPTTASNSDIGLIGALLLVIAILSFARAVQRMFERTWELPPLSVRNSANDLLWIVGLVAYLVISGVAHREIGTSRVQVGANLLLTPLTAIFLAWSGRVLSAKRIAVRDLAPFAIVASLALAVYFAGAAVYMPHLFSSYASRYGAIGAVFAMISALFGFMVALIASAALGREVFDELGRIRVGQRPPDDEVRREWDTFITEARSRWQTVREQADRMRGKRPPPGDGSAES